MTLKLIRKQYIKDGIFSELVDEAGKVLFCTLEHAYDVGGGKFEPKLKAGTYKCEQGPHRLKSMTSSFDTFEVKGVMDHTGILFHVGNYNKDSDGCILIGRKVIDYNGQRIITNSKLAFKEFMDLVSGKELVLIVK